MLLDVNITQLPLVSISCYNLQILRPQNCRIKTGILTTTTKPYPALGGVGYID